MPTSLVPPTLAGRCGQAKQAAKHENDRRGRSRRATHFSQTIGINRTCAACCTRVTAACARFAAATCLATTEATSSIFGQRARSRKMRTHGGYWWLAYDLNNYLLSCSLCNRVRKRDRFPLRPGARLRTTYSQRKRLQTERRLLLHPEWDPVEDWLRVRWEDSLCLVKPQQNLSAAAHNRVQLVIDFFRLNYDARLVRERNRLRDAVLNALDQGRSEDAKRMAIRFRPHSLVAKQVLADRAPQYLPTFGEELRWLLQDALNELLVAIEMQDQADLTDSPQERLTKELLWAFAALWLEPLTGNAAAVESLLEDTDLTEIVRPFLDAFHRPP
jgi:hypothetical protein